MTEIDSEIIKNTQKTLGEYLKKPPLTEKLLSRPPFRFLHDIVTSIITNCGFMKGLFTEEEMNSENVKEKGAKISFLKKLIGIVSLVLNTPINVNPVSIVAGKEAESTNFLLQSLAKAIGKKVDNNIYVKRTLAGEAEKLTNSAVENKNPEKHKAESDKGKSQEKSASKHRSSIQNTESAPAETKKSTETRKSKEKSVTEEKSKEQNSVEKPREKNADDKSKEKSREKPVEEKSSKRPKKERTENEPVLEKEKKEDVKTTKNKSDKRVSQKSRIDTESQEKPDSISDTKHTESPSLMDNDVDLSKQIPRPSSAKGTRHRNENDNPVLSDDKENEKRKSIVRPPSARPAPPRVKKSSEAAVDDSINTQAKVSGLIIDIDRDSDDGDYVVEEYVGGGDIDVRFSHTNVGTPLEDGEKHGLLVQSIIQSKKEFTNNEKVDTVSHSDVQRKRERVSTEKEIEKIRQNLQALTKSVNPLGKLMDFIEEDLDTMQKEFDRWHNENEELEKALHAEQSVTNKMLKPLKEKLTEQDKIIADQEEAIAKLKINIERNSAKIEKMLLNSCSIGS